MNPTGSPNQALQRTAPAVDELGVVRRFLALTIMKAIILALFTFLAVSSATFALDAAKGFETDSVVLYQPNSVLQARLGSVTDLAAYIKQVQAACSEFFATATNPENFHIVVAVRPGNRSRVWFISSVLPATDFSRDPLRKKLEAISPCDVRSGPVAFAIAAKLAGGNGKIPKGGEKDFRPPIPKEWSDAQIAKNSGPVPDCYLDVIWPDKPTK
jgi:hypothetical protein